MPVIAATQEAESRKTAGRSQPQANGSQDPILKKLIIKKKKRLVSWLKVKALCSNPSTPKIKIITITIKITLG
jgi:hypothetical protein